MRRFAVIVAVWLAGPSLAFAHVSVRPRESKPGVDERYTVRVPTEGNVATTHVRLEIPAGVAVLEVIAQDGATFETDKQAERITAITWKKEIPPKAAAEFVFRARNPTSGDIVWKAHQHFADSTVADWIGAAGERRPAAVTKLTAGAGAGEQPASDGSAATIERWLKGYDAAFIAKDLDNPLLSITRTSPFSKAAASIMGRSIRRAERFSGSWRNLKEVL